MITLEVVSPKNALAVKDIRLRALQDSPTAFSSTYAEESKLTDADWVKRAREWSGKESKTYLAMDIGLACGIAAGYLDKNDSTCGFLASMWVAPTHRRLGNGRTLVEAIVAWAHTQQLRTLLLLVTSNNDTAIHFYQRLGFSLSGKTEPYRNDPALLNYEMRRSIS